MIKPNAFTIELTRPLAAAVETLRAAWELASATLRRVMDRLASAA